MKVQLLGTGAAEGIPAIFCDCPVCRAARERGGKELRTRTSAQIHRFRLNPVEWEYVVFTHSHDDHCAVRELQYLLPPFHEGDRIPFVLCGNDAVLCRIATELDDSALLRVCRLESFQARQLGRHLVTGLRAMHLDPEDALNLLIDDGEKRALYATDTGWWPDVTWDYLAHMDKPLNLLVIDTSHGNRGNGYTGHLGIESVLKMKRILLDSGALTEGSTVVTTHHCHNGSMSHCELVECLAPHNIQVGYDGLEISL
jgi:phosphoribosyl 1,2-cyclic phosphate phosphodiesterase